MEEEQDINNEEDGKVFITTLPGSFTRKSVQKRPSFLKSLVVTTNENHRVLPYTASIISQIGASRLDESKHQKFPSLQIPHTTVTSPYQTARAVNLGSCEDFSSIKKYKNP